MNNLEKYIDNVIEQRPVGPQTQLEHSEQTMTNLISGVLRRWYIVVATFLLMCAVGLPMIWLSIKPLYSVTGAIRVAPILPNILTGSTDLGELSNYQSFMYTQAEMITSTNIVQRVADDLAGKNLSFFENEHSNFLTNLKRKLKNTKIKPEPASILKQAILDKTIIAEPGVRTELLRITMTSTNPEEAKQIVNAFISNYMAVQVISSSDDDDQKLALLENERKVLSEKLESQRAAINQLAQEYGSTTLANRHDMKLQRVASLLAELTKAESRRFYLEAQVKLAEQSKEQTIAPDELLKMRQEFLNKDPAVVALTSNIVQLDQELIVAKQTLTATNPELNRKKELLEALKARLDERKVEVGKDFDDLVSQELAKESNRKLTNIQTELEQTQAYENHLREILSKEDTETIGLGRKQLSIQELQDKFALTKEMKDQIERRIQELEMERKSPARISAAYNADIASVRDKRVKFSLALIFGTAASGIALAYLMDKADRSLRTPDDVVKHIGIRIIGTTTSSHAVKTSLLTHHIVEDYQTIRANLGLLNGEGIPKKLVVTSSEMQEGKTTFAINLATTLAKAGKKVLLIDGDLRKPDIASLLNLPPGSRGLQDVLFGKDFNQAIYSIASTGLDVLAADSRNTTDAYELLASPITNQQLNLISRNYDHLIIDTPPVLAFPDALIWAKIADAVILTSFAGQTTVSSLNEAKQRLAQINVRVLGTVLNNVRAGHSYYRYRYNYHTQNVMGRKNSRQAKTKLLLPVESQQNNVAVNSK